MKTTLFLLLSSLMCSFSNAQLLGVYEFTGSGACPHQNPNVTTQPLNTEFEAFTRQNVFCVSTQNVYNTDSWNTSAVFNQSEFIQFGLHTVSCFRFDVDSIVFDYRNTQTGGTPTWHLRSNIDNYASDLASGQSMTLSGSNMLTSTIVFNTSNFSLLTAVKFRIYLTQMGSSGAAFRIDNVRVYGSETLVGMVDYYVDNDGDGYGTGTPIQACVNPGGYSLNNLDCDDTRADVNPDTFWYNDADGDGFGNDLTYEIGCTSTFANPVTNSDDCDDSKAEINPQTLWYQDNDGDGFGDDNITEIGCTSTLTNPVLIGGDCSDIASDLNPNTVWYEDLDGDFYGNDLRSEIGCTYTFSAASMTKGDCDDTNPNVNPDQYEDECDDDGIDNNCDGTIDENYDFDLCNGGGGGSNDFDGDGFDEIDDCDDTNPSIYPGAIEIPDNGIDENCDGVDGYLSISENKILTLNIYPNPANNSFFISAKDLNLGSSTISICDNQGKVILVQKADFSTSESLEIDMSKFENGVYIVSIGNDSHVFRKVWSKI